VFLLSLLRRNLDIQKEKCIFGATKRVKLMSIFRLLKHFLEKYKVGFKELDIKQAKLYENIPLLVSQADFIEAVRKGDIAKCKEILAIKETAINSIDTKSEYLDAPLHIAVQNDDKEMVRFLARQRNVNIEICDIDG
jgi:hypothetical protein